MPSLNKQILIGVIAGVVIGALLTQLNDASSTAMGFCMAQRWSLIYLLIY